MKRKEIISLSASQKNDASCIGNKRKMARHAKTHGAKVVRQALKKRMNEEI